MNMLVCGVAAYWFFLNFVFIDLGVVSITSSLLLIVFLFVKVSRCHFEVDRRVFVILVLMLVVPVLNIYQIFDSYYLYDQLVEFFKSYLYWFVFVSFLAGASSWSFGHCDQSNIFKALAFSYVALFFISLMQFSFAKLGYFGLYEIFGDSLYNRSNSWWYRNSEWVANGGMQIRTPALYYEPSFFGIVFLCLHVCILVVGRYVWLSMFLSLMAIPIIASANYSVFVLLINFMYFSMLVKSGQRLLFFTLGVMLVALVAFFIIGSRIQEIFIEGSSGYYRIIGPLKVILYSIEYNPFGLIFGGGERIIEKVGVWQSFAEGKEPDLTIDNGLFAVVINFGYLSLFVFVGLSYIIYKAAFGDFKPMPNDVLVLGFFVFYVFFTTGAVFAFDVLSMFAFLAFVLRNKYIGMASGES